MRAALVCSVTYGAAMGCSDLRLWQTAYSAIKLPLLLGATFAIALPSFFVINSIAGVRDDFPRVLRALMNSQSWLTSALLSLAPLVLLGYVSTADHELHIVLNGIAFAIASGAAQISLRRDYAPLIARAPAHARLLKLWIVLYAFVGIQAAWVLRPFVGDPERATQFLRDDPWTNAYVWIARMIGRVIFATS
jgi:hypothetical protein